MQSHSCNDVFFAHAAEASSSTRDLCYCAIHSIYTQFVCVFIYIYSHIFIYRERVSQFCRMIVGPSNREAKIVDLTDESEEKALLGKVAGGCG